MNFQNKKIKTAFEYLTKEIFRNLYISLFFIINFNISNNVEIQFALTRNIH